MPAKQPRHIPFKPRVHKVEEPPPGTDLNAVAQKCRYAGSPYHKIMPDRYNNRPVYHRGKSKCPRELQNNPAQVTEWLRAAIRQGQCGKFENGFPRRVWYRDGNDVFQANLHNRESGEYHGFPLEPHDHIIGLE